MDRLIETKYFIEIEKVSYTCYTSSIYLTYAIIYIYTEKTTRTKTRIGETEIHTQKQWITTYYQLGAHNKSCKEKKKKKKKVTEVSNLVY
jgi:hypothetical protein